MSDPASIQIVSHSPESTFALGKRLGELLDAGAVLGLSGELGSGKTLFTKGLACGLGVREHGRVNSPTFVIQQQYIGRLRIHHYDTYRLHGVDDLIALGFDEDVAAAQAGDRVVVIEWADRVRDVLPPQTLEITFEHAGSDVAAIPPPGDEFSKDGEAGISGTRLITFSGRREAWGGKLESLKN